MRGPAISRRMLLRGAGGVCLALPFLEAMAKPLATRPRPRGGPPRRFIVFYTPNGTVMEHWRPSGSEYSFTPGKILEPVKPYIDDIVVLDGVDNLSAYHGTGDAHQRGTGQVLTCRRLQKGDFKGSTIYTAGWADGISVDQQIADAIAGNTKFRSLEFGVRVKGATVSSRISYRGPGQPLPPEVDPVAGFKRIFGDAQLSAEELARRLAERKTVLDAVASDYERLLPRVSASDRIKLEGHLAAIRDIEMRLGSGDVDGKCAPPKLGSPFDPYAIANAPALGKLQIDLMVAALACDQTRVASIMWANSSNTDPFPWLGIDEQHHDLAHEGDGNDSARDKLVKINTWYAEQFAYLLSRLKSVQEGEGTLLDNTLLVWVNEHQKGNNHDRYGMPYLLAGRAGGSVKTGRWMQLDGDVPHNNLWVGCMQAMGLEVTTFGDPEFCDGVVGLG
jgi:hypothetical protein